MLRVCAIVIVTYNCGYPGLAGLRPAVLDQPLAGFHHHVNESVVQAVSGAQQAGNMFMVFAGSTAERVKREFAGSAAAKD